jgi:hypothetical protein
MYWCGNCPVEDHLEAFGFADSRTGEKYIHFVGRATPLAS